MLQTSHRNFSHVQTAPTEAPVQPFGARARERARRRAVEAAGREGVGRGGRQECDKGEGRWWGTAGSQVRGPRGSAGRYKGPHRVLVPPSRRHFVRLVTRSVVAALDTPSVSTHPHAHIHTHTRTFTSTRTGELIVIHTYVRIFSLTYTSIALSNINGEDADAATSTDAQVSAPLHLD